MDSAAERSPNLFAPPQAAQASGRVRRSTRAEQLKHLPHKPLQRLHHSRLGQMRAGGLPVAQAGQPPTLRLIGEAADRHPQQAWPGQLTRRWLLKPQLNQKGAALAAGAPTRQVKGEIEAVLLSVRAGLWVVAPRGEVGAGIREVLAKQHGNGSHTLRQFHGSDLVGRIHAVAPAAEQRIPKT